MSESSLEESDDESADEECDSRGVPSPEPSPVSSPVPSPVSTRGDDDDLPPTHQDEPEPAATRPLRVPPLDPRGVPLPEDATGRFLLHGPGTVLEAARTNMSYDFTPVFRCVRAEAAKAVYIPSSERWFYEALPGLVICPTRVTSDNGCSVTACPADLAILQRNMRYGTRGEVVSISPRLARYMVFMWIVDKRRHTASYAPEIPIDLQLAGTTRMCGWGLPVRSYQKLVGKCTNLLSVAPCKCAIHTAGRSSVDIHPDGEFVTGSPICRACFAIMFSAVLPGWFSLDTLRCRLPRLLYGRTFGRLGARPIQHVLSGMAIVGMAKPGLALTLGQYAAIGRGAIVDPVRYLTLTPRDPSMSASVVAAAFGPTKWRLFADIIATRRVPRVMGLLHALGPIGTPIRSHLDYFGWTLVSRTMRPKGLVVEFLNRSDLYNTGSATIGHSLVYAVDLVRGLAGPQGGTRRAGNPHHFLMWGSTILGLRALAKCSVVVSLVSGTFVRPPKLQPQATSVSAVSLSQFKPTKEAPWRMDAEPSDDESITGDDDDDHLYTTPPPPPRSCSPPRPPSLPQPAACALLGEDEGHDSDGDSDGDSDDGSVTVSEAGAAPHSAAAVPLPLPPASGMARVAEIWVSTDNIFNWDRSMAVSEGVRAPPPPGTASKQLRAFYSETTFHITDAHRLQWSHFHRLVERIGATNLVLHGSLFNAIEGDKMYHGAYDSDDPDHPCALFPHPELGGVFAYLYDAVALGPSSAFGSHIGFRTKSMKRELTPLRHQALSFDPHHAAVAAAEREYFRARHTVPWLGVEKEGAPDIDEVDPVAVAVPTLHPAWATYHPLLPLEHIGAYPPPSLWGGASRA
jgi:hypothetical protein